VRTLLPRWPATKDKVSCAFDVTRDINAIVHQRCPCGVSPTNARDPKGNASRESKCF